MNSNGLPFNWFDVAVLAVLGFGLFRGRKRGMSEELNSVLMWLSIVICCAFLYLPLGTVIAGSGSGNVFSELSSYLMAYVAAGLLIAAIFALMKKSMGSKLVSSETFGRSEYYLGMVAGMVRFGCILIVGLALLNARAYSQKEIKADVKYQNDVYGSTFFPKLYTVQSQVFEKSLMGPWIKENLGPLLIKPTPPVQKQLRQKEVALP